MIKSSFQYKSDIIEYLTKDLNLVNEIITNKAEQLHILLRWLCTVPKYTTYRINTLITTGEKFAKTIAMEFHKQAEMRGDSVVAPSVLVHPSLPELVVVGSWQEHCLDLSQLEQQVIVDAACGVAVLRGAHVFAPGVMGMPTGVHEGDRVSVYADLARRCKRGFQHTYTDDKLFVGNGIARMGRKQLYGKDVKSVGIAIEITDPVSGCPNLGLDCLPSNLALLQNLPSVVSCRVLDPHPSERVLDMCAAPGNKTSHLAMLMENQGLIIALDKTESKVNAIRKRCMQFSIHCVEAHVYDATKAVLETANRRHSSKENVMGCKGMPCTGISKNENEETIHSVESQEEQQSSDSNKLSNVPPFLPETFDKILLDAPCSALGQRPQLVNNISEKQLKSYPSLQKKLFVSAVTLLKHGGCMVYSTCTVTVAENEALVVWALNTFPCLRLSPALPRLGGPGLPGMGLTEEQRQCVQRFGPPEPTQTPECGSNDTVGFFIAYFTKE